jgi:hypothetical protein
MAGMNHGVNGTFVGEGVRVGVLVAVADVLVSEGDGVMLGVAVDVPVAVEEKVGVAVTVAVRVTVGDGVIV